MAVSGHNGDNETFIGFSSSIGLSFYDENNKEIKITNTQSPIHMYIPRDANLEQQHPFQHVNASQIQMYNLFFLTNGLYINSGINVSLTIELKPYNKSIGYVLVMKLGQSPIINATYADFNSLKVFCPQDLQNTFDSFYSFFQNKSQLNGFKGFVGFGLRELNLTEIQTYCKNSSSSQKFLVQNQVNFTSDFQIRAYTSGCYFYDTQTGKWSSDGMEIHSDTNIKQTHCSSFHLTSFAGGLIVLPPEINFKYVFANASFIRNPIVYSTVILIGCFYILMALWSRYMDKIDNGKLNILPIESSDGGGGNYFYEIIVFTGNRSESATHSKVDYFVLKFLK
jgi:hypothetical protein